MFNDIPRAHEQQNLSRESCQGKLVDRIYTRGGKLVKENVLICCMGLLQE